MAQGISGTFDLTGSMGVSARVSYAETYDAARNTSCLTVTAVEVASAIYYHRLYYLNGGIDLNGEALAEFDIFQGTHNVYIAAQNTWTAIRGSDLPPWQSGELLHGEDGTGRVTLAVKLYGETSAGEYWNVAGQQEITLTPIPQTPTVTAPETAELGDGITISVTAPGGDLSWEFAGETGVIAQAVTGSVDWVIPKNLAGLIPADSAGVLTVVCGAASAAVEVTVPQRAPFLPTLDAVLTPEGADLGLYIRGVTAIRGHLSGASAYSEIERFSMTVEGISYEGERPLSHKLGLSGEATVRCAVTDKRGFTAVVEKTVTVLPYDAPRVVSLGGSLCCRCLYDGTESPTGGNLKITAGVKFTSIVSASQEQNAPFLHARWKQAGGDYGDWTSLTPGEEAVFLDAVPSATASYTVQLRASDALGGESTVTVPVSTAAVAFHLKKGGNGAAFGKYAEADNTFEVSESWDVLLKGYPLADFVVETGEYGGWFWRKWLSGRAECMGTGSMDALPVVFLGTPLIFNTDAAVLICGRWKGE